MFLFLVDLLVHVFDGLETPDKKMEALAKKYIQLVSVCLIDLFSILVDSKLYPPPLFKKSLQEIYLRFNHGNQFFS